VTNVTQRRANLSKDRRGSTERQLSSPEKARLPAGLFSFHPTPGAATEPAGAAATHGRPVGSRERGRGIPDRGEPTVTELLIVSTMTSPEVAEYPDTGTVLAITGPTGRWAFGAGSAGAFTERVVEAMRAGDEHEAE
jgi:hypothetical protein